MVMTRQKQKKAHIFAAGDKYTLWPQLGHVLPAHSGGRTANSESSVGLFSRSSRATSSAATAIFMSQMALLQCKAGRAEEGMNRGSQMRVCAGYECWPNWAVGGLRLQEVIFRP